MEPYAILEEEGGEDEVNTSIPSNRGGYSVKMASIFIVGTMCGSGILALPFAMYLSGYIGLLLLVACGAVSAYTGDILGRCWAILRSRYPEYCGEENIPDPYNIIGYRAAGNVGLQATRVSNILQLFGGGVGFILLISGNIESVVESFSSHSAHLQMTSCYWILVVTCVLIPLSWLGTPKDFWQAGVIAASTTAVGAVLIAISIGVNVDRDVPVLHKDPSVVTFFTAFGTILFAFGGASCFPNIQVDMKQPDKFPLAVVLGILAVLTLYFPVCATSYFLLGDKLEATNGNIITILREDWMKWAVVILITSHLLMAFLIVINPVTQDLENMLSIPNRFSLKRLLLRSTVTILMGFVALTIPHFGIIASLVGGSFGCASNFIFPPLFYILLSKQKKSDDAYGEAPKSNDIYTSSNATTS